MLREDGTGAIEYFYGKMGEVTKTRRTMIVPNQAIATYMTQWTYDSHNRLLEMIYPDEEKITYSYNLGGQLERVHGYKSYGYDYVSKIGYDKFEQRTYLKYCNGAETFYTYAPQCRTMARTTTTMSMARWCSILSMCLSVKSLLRNATTFGITPYLFNAKEFDEETGMYYYGARYYEPRLSLWMSVDPLQEKYPNISTYCYAANNPIKFIDSDGRKLLFASGTTEAFKQKFRAAIMYLHEHNADGIIAQIDKSSTIIYITERVGEASAFSKTKKTIYWDPNMGVLTSSDKKMSPAAVLNHEADHTLQYLKNPDKFAQDSKTLDPDYNDKEEMRVITGSEQKTALALGEISAGEVTRTDHIGIPYITKSPTTTEAKDGKIPKNPFVMDEIVISVPKSKNVNPNNDNNETDNK